jgi:SpoIIAA-like
MIEPIADMPPNTFGFRGSGKFTTGDYTEVLIPALRAAVDRGEPVRFLLQIDPDFHGIEPDAVWEQAKADLGLGVGHLSAWERIAVVSDADWVRRAISLFGWMSPGELRAFGREELEAAKEWVAG